MNRLVKANRYTLALAAALVLFIVLCVAAAPGRAAVLAPKWLGTFGRDGSGPGQFHTVTGIATDGQGHLYVADGNTSGGQRRPHRGLLPPPAPGPAGSSTCRATSTRPAGWRLTQAAASTWPTA